jgi:diaminohydroxyphosphoribosylaminopyrimidine deaminase / 5-amino-6-(5-phosphoribosylamino)uracil reductase
VIPVSPDDERHMRRALALAELGRGAVEPNPMVGAVVVDASGAVAGEGWHTRFGGPHAEVVAFSAAGDRARGGTLYVTLEPCCHHGKTPPCTDAVLRAGVRRVVVSGVDPFPKVAGGGIGILRGAGLLVDVGLCEAESQSLNAPYLKLLATGTPWVIAKWAMTLDGKIATRTGESKWISNDDSRRRVHELRGRVDALLVGRGTVVADDPLLTARPLGPRVAARVVLSTSGELPARCQLLDTARAVPVIVFTRTGNESKLTAWSAAGAEVVAVPECTVPAILADLGRRRFTNVLVEGGAGVLGAFHDADALDEVQAYLAPKLFGGVAAPGPIGGLGVASVADAFEDVWFAAVGTDLLVVARRRSAKA